MLISSLQNTGSSLTELTATSASSSTSNKKNSFDTALSNLMSAIQSGNTTDAQKYLAQVEKLTPSNADSDSPLGKFIASVTTALSNDDIAGAQSALTTLEASAISGSSAADSVSSASSATSDTSSSTALSAVGRDVLDLFGAIGSGDVSAAKSAYESLMGLLDNTDSASTSSASSSTDSSSGSSSATTTFKDLLKQIGSALNSGDVNSAQTALNNFLTSLSSGSLVNVKA